jgi:UDP-N-acetylmuramoyl-L-alanyl-D-glutamate--2,6-diaminopimelate ligase
MSIRPSDASRDDSLRSLLPESVFVGATDLRLGDVQRHAHRCRKGSLLVAGLDSQELSEEQVQLAMQRGAQGILAERLLPFPVAQCLVPDVRTAYATVCHALAGNPSEELLTVGVVGTHGKTTLSLLLSSMLKSVGGRVGYSTSLGAHDGQRAARRPVAHPTPRRLSRWMRSTVGAGAPGAVVEISERMLLERRCEGITFDVLVVPSLRPSQRGASNLAPNLWQEGLERLCGQLKPHGLILYNTDDAKAYQWMEQSKVPGISYGLDADADVRGRRLNSAPGELSMMVTAGCQLMPLTSKLIGDHSARHLLGAIATGYAFGLELHEIIGGVERLQKIPGRMQRVMVGQEIPVTIDLADQPDRLAVALHGLAQQHQGPIHCVAEVPHDATAEVRAAYGRVLERSASQIYLTQSRRPGQAGQRATWEVLDGCKRPAAIHLVPNRRCAIELAIRSAADGDQVLLAGWGADRWTSGQDRQPQSDQSVAEAVLRDVAAQSPARHSASIDPATDLG